jgi:hypothetical protein
MKARYIALLILAFVGGGVVHAQSPNWLLELMVVRAPQTQVARHPSDKGKFYLCWQDGADRYGIYFRKRNFDDRLRTIQPGTQVSLSSILSINESGWTAQDEKICWPG